MPFRTIANANQIADGVVTAAKMADHVLPGRVFRAEPDGLTQSGPGPVALTPQYDPEGMWDGENDWIEIKRNGLYLIVASFLGIPGSSPKELCIKHLANGPEWYSIFSLGVAKPSGSFGDVEAATAVALHWLTTADPAVQIVITSSMGLNDWYDNHVTIAQLA